MINIHNPRHEIFCRNWFWTFNFVLLNSGLSLNVCVLTESLCYMSSKDWLPAPYLLLPAELIHICPYWWEEECYFMVLIVSAYVEIVPR